MACAINCVSNERLQNINDAFPEEMFLKIFGFLDLTTLKNLLLVNKRWYDIVTNDISTMKKLPLTIRGDVLRKNHLIVKELGPKFYKILFKSIKKCYNVEMLSKLNAIGANVCEIEFIQCYVNEPEVFQNILRNFPKVEKLTFKQNLFRNRYKISDTNVLELKNHNEIVFNQHSLMMLRSIGAQLKSLKVNIPTHFDEYPESLYRNEQQLMEFLYTQKRLNTLALRNINSLSEVFAKKENVEYQFKLKKLSLRRISFEEEFEDENLKEFLNTQKDSIEILELGSTFSDDVYELILNKFENVKTISITISDFPADLSFYKRIKINFNVTKLLINGVIENVVQYCTILSLFPNVTNINFSCYIPFEVLSWLSKCCNVLTSLSLNSLCRGKYQNLKFSALKSLHLECLDDDNDNKWSDLVMSNQTIESLSFRSISRSYKFDPENSFGIKLMMTCAILPNLKNLKLGENIKVNLGHLQKIVEMCKNLESIDVMGDKMEVGMMPMRKGFKLRYHGKSTVRFIFPTQDPVWEDSLDDYDDIDSFDYEDQANLSFASDTDYSDDNSD